jgi:hypothetical protein
MRYKRMDEDRYEYGGEERREKREEHVAVFQ